MIMNKGFKTKIYPTNEQIKYFNKCFGIRRLAYNWTLNKINENLKTKTLKQFKFGVEFNRLRETEFPFIFEVNNRVYKYAIEDCKKCYYDKSKGFPKFKSKKNPVQSFTTDLIQNKKFNITNKTFTIKRNDSKKHLDNNKYLTIKTSESIKFLKNKKITGLSISYENNDYYVSFNYQTSTIEYNNHKYDKIGIDLGLKTFSTQSDSKVSKLPKQIKILEKKIEKQQSKMDKKVKNSNNYMKTKCKFNKLNKKLKNIRKDFLHKYTTYLTKTYKNIAIEDLKISNMNKNHNLAKSINRNSFYTFRSMLEYKVKWYNSNLVIVDQWYPSSKLCSICGNKKKDLKLSDRVYICDCCGSKMDRDLNASINLEKQII